MSDFAAHFALVGVKPEMSFHVAQIVIATARVGFIRAAEQWTQGQDRGDQRASENSRQRTTSANVNHYFSSGPRRALRGAAKRKVIIRKGRIYGFVALYFDADSWLQEASDQAAIDLNGGAVHRASALGTKKRD